MAAPFYFPDSRALLLTQYGPVGYGAIIAPAATANNATSLYAIGPADGVPALWPGGVGAGLAGWPADISYRITDISSFQYDASVVLVGGGEEHAVTTVGGPRCCCY